MRRGSLAALACVIALGAAPAVAQIHVASAAGFGSGPDDRLVDTALLPDGGAIVLIDSSYGATDLGGGAMAGSGSLESDFCLLRVDASLAHVWSRRYGGPGRDSAHALAVDATGNVYVSGEYHGAATQFGGAELPIRGSNDGFVASFGPDGTHRWSHAIATEALDGMGAMLVDGSTLLVAGSSSADAVEVGVGAALPTGEFLVRYALDGTPREAHHVDGSIVSMVPGVGGPCVAGGNRVACLVADGTPRWTTTIPWAQFGDLVVTSDGGVLASGHVPAGGTIEGTSMAPALGDDALVVAFDAHGTRTWARTWGGPSDDSAHEIVLDASGARAIVSGTIRSPRGRRVVFGHERFDPGPHTDVVLFAISASDGSDVTAISFGSIEFDYAGSLSREASGAVLLGMTFGVTMRAGTQRHIISMTAEFS